MLGEWVKRVLQYSLLAGLCLPVQANTTAPEAKESTVPAAVLAQSAVVTSPVDLGTTQRLTSIALLLPVRSETLREASEVLRAGFQAAYEREHDGVTVNIVETGDTPQDILSGYKSASALNDIVVGPLSRTGVTAVAQNGAVTKPTIALTTPDHPDGLEARLPPHMLVMGLSIEDEARQVADWAGQDAAPGKAIVLFTATAWQRRAAKAFDTQWRHQGFETESVELPAIDGFLNGKVLLQLKKQVESDKPSLLFLALDARQARQVRAVMNKNNVALYGTSQLNPFALSDRSGADRAEEMDGTRLLDIPWQLQADHPAVMVYPRLVVNADQKRNPDLERLYALGIDAYRVAREISMQHTRFEMDGVTGKLTVNFDNTSAHFERAVQQAVYRDGLVMTIGEAR